MTFGRTQRRIAAMAGGALALVALSHVIVEAAGWRLLQPAADESLRVVEAWRQRGEPVDVALLGSSRMRRAVTVPVFEEELSASLGEPVTAFNFGLQAGTAPSFYLVTRDVLRDELAPKLIVVGLGVRALNGNNPRYERTIRHMAAPFDLIGPLGPRLSSGSELGAGVLAVFRAPGSLLQAWRIGAEPEAEIAALLARKGSIHRPAEPDPMPAVEERDRIRRELADRTQKRARRTRELLLADLELEGRGRWALEQLLAIANERSISVVVVNLPVSGAFAAAAYEDEHYNRYFDVLREVCGAASVTLIDGNRPQRPPDHYFHDGDHLNAVGATAFSRWLAHELGKLRN